MPTTTSTLTKPAYSPQIPLKGAISLPNGPSHTSPPSPSTTNATLRPLYNRAARAFLHRDVLLAQSLIESAFAFLPPPRALPDQLAEDRRKWDLLRITFETTVYSSPPLSKEQSGLPESLRNSLIQSPQAFVTSLYARSLALFTPLDEALGRKGVPDAVYLPAPVVMTVIYSSLKLGCPDTGRVVVEDWFARRNTLIQSPDSQDQTTEDGYEKILELYCLHILPRLEEWDYAEEFLEYEVELSPKARDNMKEALRAAHAKASSSSSHFHLPSESSTPMPPRSGSPTPSSSSSSSFSSTASTHTVVPSSRNNLHPLTTLNASNPASSSTSSFASDKTAKPLKSSSRPAPQNRPADPSSSSTSSFPRPYQPVPSSVVRSPANLSLYELVKVYLGPYMTTSNLATLFIVLVVIPVVSAVLRLRRRRAALTEGRDVASNAELVRRRLQNASGGVGVDVSFLRRAWMEAVRAVVDTIRMAGSGLV